MVVINREYQRRAARQVLDQVGLAAVQDNSGFYRPAKRTAPGSLYTVGTRKKGSFRTSGKLQGVQLELFTSHFPTSNEETKQEVNQDPERPLCDLFPEAYQ